MGSWGSGSSEKRYWTVGWWCSVEGERVDVGAEVVEMRVKKGVNDGECGFGGWELVGDIVGCWGLC